MFVFLFFVTSFPAYALKDVSGLQWGEIQPVEIIYCGDMMNPVIKHKKSIVEVYVSNLDCKEYSRTYKLMSTSTITYVLPRQGARKISGNVSAYVQNLFEQNKGNIYFKANGYGIYSNLVGEFYIGDTSLNKHLIEKGYCVYVK